MPVISFEVEYYVEVQIINQWYEKEEPTASLGHAIRIAKKLMENGYKIDEVRIVKHTDRKEVIEVNLE